MPRKPRNSPNPPGRPPRTSCRRCGAPGRRGQELSTRGICDPCWQSALIQTVIEIRQRRGPYYERWRAGILRWVERELAADRVFEQDRRTPTPV